MCTSNNSSNLITCITFSMISIKSGLTEAVSTYFTMKFQLYNVKIMLRTHDVRIKVLFIIIILLRVIISVWEFKNKITIDTEPINITYILCIMLK